MSSAPPIQDLPPPGGFPETIRYQRYLPKRGPSGAVLFGSVIGICTYGWYWLLQMKREQRELDREKAWTRFHLVPILQAELDRDMYRRTIAMKEREAEIMSDVPGWVPGDLKAPTPGLGKFGEINSKMAEPVYHTPRYVQPTIVLLDDKIMKDSPRGKI